MIARQNKDAVNLYLDYHFSEKVKKEGNRIEEFKITDEYEHLITEIQEAAINLLKASHDNSNLIQHGTELAVGLEDRFTNISNSAKLNSQSANEIQYLVQQQTKAFDQIVQTLQQISTSIQGFSVSTRNLIETSKNLQDNVDKLESSSLPESQESK